MTALAVVAYLLWGLGTAGAVITAAPKSFERAERWIVVTLGTAVVIFWPLVLAALGVISVVGIVTAVGLNLAAKADR